VYWPLFFHCFQILTGQYQKVSPEATAEYKKDDTEISVFYCRPSKKGRVIFGGLEPYGKVWRTGANEATTFTTNKALTIGGKTFLQENTRFGLSPTKRNGRLFSTAKCMTGA
jgi:hypothetical protein